MKTALPLYSALPTPEEMRQWDEAAHSLFGIPPLLLMENAAQAAFAVLKEHYSLSPESAILIFMGRGNNGGDGAAMARLLHDAGHTVLVCSAGSLEKLASPAKEHVEMAQKTGVAFLPLSPGEFPLLPPEWRSPDIIVDAITGTGIRGRLRAEELALINAINALRKKTFILSLDIPSGLSGYTGRPQPEAVRAHVTVAFEAGKPGLYVPEAREFTGLVTVRRVGIPLALRSMMPASWQLLEPHKASWAKPPLLQHKGSAGKVLVIGGSEGMAGAPLLAALGSLRAGAGLVHAALPADLEPAVRSAYPEILTHPVGTASSWSESDAALLIRLLQKLSPGALVIGPGMGRTPAVRETVRAILAQEKRPPAVVDADALHFFRLPKQQAEAKPGAQIRMEPADESEEGCAFSPLPMELLTEKDMLTPHIGEMARMLPSSFFSNTPGSPADIAATPLPRSRIEHIREDRARAVQSFTEACKAVLVLKGPGTLIGRCGNPTTLSPIAAPALAVGGSGDVLAGVCASLIASGACTLDAACLAVYLHGRAGEILAQKSPRGHLARDIADAVPLVWKELCGK